MADRDSRQLVVSRVIDAHFVEEADRVLVALRNLLDRSLNAPVSEIPGYQPLLLVTAYAARNTFNTIRFLLADKPQHHDRKLEYSLAVSPLIRFLIDLLFTIVVIRQKPRKYVMWYHRSGWRELKEALGRLKAEPGASKRFSRQIAKQSDALEYLRKTYKISLKTARSPDKIPYWPHPGQFLKNKKLRLRPRQFMSYLHTWFYSELSQEAHASSAGVVRMYSKLLIESTDVDQERILKVIKSNNFMMSLVLALSIATELNDIGRFDRGPKLKYLWQVLVSEWFDGKRLFDRRYKRMLRRHS